jgi:hypothetical protein
MRKFTSGIHIKYLAGLLLTVLFFNTRVSAQIVFSEINYHSDTTRNSGEWVEVQNLGSMPVDLTGWIFSDSQSVHFYVIPPGTVVAPGQYVVICNDTTSFKSQYPGVPNRVGPFNFGLGNKGDMLRLFDAQSNLIVSMTYLDSLGWPKAADGHGRTLEVRNAAGNLNDPANWYAGCMFGSPGSAPSPCQETIIFSEINYHSDPEVDSDDWVEIRNIGTQPADISNWILRDKNDSVSFVIPGGTVLQPGQNIVACKNLFKFMYWFPGATNVVGDFTFGLKNSKDVIRLFNAQGNLVYSIAYRSDGFWPSGADGLGYTLELIDSTGIMNDGNNWKTGCVGGSPGRHYSPDCNMLGISNEHSETAISVYPNPFSSHAVIELKGADLENVSVTITDAIGRKVKELAPAASEAGTSIIHVDRSGLSAGIYFYVARSGDRQLGAGKLVIKD